jgi:hypothetical protein
LLALSVASSPPPAAGQYPLELGGRGAEVAAGLRDRDPEVGRLEVARVLGQDLLRRLVGFVEVSQVAEGTALQVEGIPVLGIGLKHSLRLGQGLRVPLGPLEDVAKAQVHPQVAGLDLESLAVMQDGLVGLLGPRVDLAQGLVGPDGRL